MKNIFAKRKKLTNRQIECMKALISIYNTKNEPIHYSDLAPILKISKWSTYDLLKTLERKGLVKPVYKELDTKRPTKKGRRAVFFVPLFEYPTNGLEDDLIQSKKDDFEKKGFTINLKNISQISPKIYCISFLTAIGIICFESFHDIIPLIQHYIVTLSHDPKNALICIAYSLVGIVIGNLKTPEAKKIIEINLNQYTSYIEKMSEKSLKEILSSTVSFIESC
ncbi:MAG TPA: hypothetical protein PK455_01905 [Caldisericia bacterium]|jgi:predicted transcriptional regulator|nr:hypothetical protein [Caldisericia bacterium]